MRIFKTKRFGKLARKASITDTALKEAAGQVENFTDLGGDVYKLRFARDGEGKSGGYRFILFFRQGDKLILKYLFSKSNRANIKDDELKEFKDDAKTMLSLTNEQIEVQKKLCYLKELL
ncbi:MAG: type II toxin-antitoxin system RelE/ParE family toxin [Candidatus Endomicrobiellum trichonymphae]|uniref:type II toxin-antitoxin system RelE/ParE family toxin n=1 Tax=Endomicrobium trichonymphae TaxID=1408204 RepID=UPI0027D3E808|nr:MAG: type II toxin-antitoxin system RelE/ParE family toxin [Candidatus Endomicrobium trichonymphae]